MMAQDHQEDNGLPFTLINSIYDHDMATFLHHHQQQRDALSLTSTDQDGKTLLHHAICANDLEIFNYILTKNHKEQEGEGEEERDLTTTNLINLFKHKDMAGWTPLHSVVSIGNALMLKLMLDKMLSSTAQSFCIDWLMEKTRAGKTALHYACSKGHLDIVLIITGIIAKDNPLLMSRFLMEQDLIGQTCLHRAAAIGRGDILHTLLESVDTRSRNTLLSLKDKEGKRARDIALEAGYLELAQRLVTINNE